MNSKEIKKIDKTIIEDLKIKVFNKIIEVHKNLEGIYKFKIPSIPILFTKRGTVAGCFTVKRSGELYINFNMGMLINNTDDFVKNLVPHEYCHYVVYLISKANPNCKVKAHGKEWKAMMVSLGVEPERCHNYDVAQKNYYKYLCECDEGVYVGPQVHKKITQDGLGKNYRCKKCKVPLKNTMFSTLVKL